MLNTDLETNNLEKKVKELENENIKLNIQKNVSKLKEKEAEVKLNYPRQDVKINQIPISQFTSNRPAQSGTTVSGQFGSVKSSQSPTELSRNSSAQTFQSSSNIQIQHKKPSSTLKKIGNKIKQKRSTFIGLALITVIGIVAFGFNYITTNTNQNSEIIILTNEQIIDIVKTSINLGTDELTIAEVKDPSKLPQEPFFRDTQVGDKVLIYQNTKAVVLFRPSTGLIINYDRLK